MLQRLRKNSIESFAQAVSLRNLLFLGLGEDKRYLASLGMTQALSSVSLSLVGWDDNKTRQAEARPTVPYRLS